MEASKPGGMVMHADNKTLQLQAWKGLEMTFESRKEYRVHTFKVTTYRGSGNLKEKRKILKEGLKTHVVQPFQGRKGA